MTEIFRRPATFRADDPRVDIAPPEIVLRDDTSDKALVRADGQIMDSASRRRWRWGTLFWSAACVCSVPTTVSAATATSPSARAS